MYIYKTVIYFCIFSIITPVFRVTWSSEIIIIYSFAAQETFLLIIINFVETFENFGVSKSKENKLINALVNQGCIKLIKNDSKDIYNITKDLYFK